MWPTGYISTLSYTMGFAFNIGLFVLICIAIIILIILSPTQNSFFDVDERLQLTQEPIIKELVGQTGADRFDLVVEPQATGHEWLPYPRHSYVVGDIDYLPLFMNGKYGLGAERFPLLFDNLATHSNILNVFLWRIYPYAALKEHTPDQDGGVPESCILGQEVRRYTLPINSLSCSEEDCSLWVGGQIRKLVFDVAVMWDPNKEFSIHHQTSNDGPIYFLNIDFAVDVPKKWYWI